MTNPEWREKRINLLIAKLEFEAIQMDKCGEIVWATLAREAVATIKELRHEDTSD